MPLPDPDFALARFIIRAIAPLPLTELIAQIAPGLRIVDQIGPAGQPHTVVIEVPADQADSLEQRIRASGQLTIEPDRPLSLFGAALSPVP